jgi:hypothetical protein
MTKFRFISTLIILFLAGGLGAQTSGDSDTSKLKKKTIKVNVIDPKGKKRVQYSGAPIFLDSVQKAVKLDPMLLFRGEFSVFFEWRLSRHFSVEGAGGITYIDFAYETFENNARFLPQGEEANSAQFHSGISVRLQPRYFPSRYETAIEGFYMAPTFCYRTWNMTYFINNGLVSFPHPVKREWTEFRLQIGEQDCDPYSVFFTEWYLNFGVQIRNDDRVLSRGVTAEIAHITRARLVFGAGVKIGFVL